MIAVRVASEKVKNLLIDPFGTWVEQTNVIYLSLWPRNWWPQCKVESGVNVLEKLSCATLRVWEDEWDPGGK